MTVLRYGTSLVLRDSEGSALIDWASDADRCKTNLAHATARAKMWIGEDPYPVNSDITLTHVIDRDYTGQNEYHWTAPDGKPWVLVTSDLTEALDMVRRHLAADQENLS